VLDVEEWNFDGSSTGQAPGGDSEIVLRPVALFPDPFAPSGASVFVLCACYEKDGSTPARNNTRDRCAARMLACASHVPWFGIEQEYTLFERDGVTPLGWPADGFPAPQGPYYCGVGTRSSFGRAVVEAHCSACLRAGVTLSGTNAEVMPSQWEYQVGPCTGIDSGDHMAISRYIMLRVCEEQGVVCSFDPKPVAGDWNGAGCHVNFSTQTMREPGGITEILAAIGKLSTRHGAHMALYGAGNERRMTGRHETAGYDTFSHGVADRGASVRIPRLCDAQKCGYFEDRRPAANMDPYVVTGELVYTTLLPPTI
jgi:glutamine synthetase